MNEQLVVLETAILAKEKGFDEPTIDYWEKRNEDWKEEYPPSYDFGYSNYNNSKTQLSRPTQSLLQKWLREVHKLHITITSISQESWQYHITKVGESLGIRYEQDFSTYEEALEVGLIEGLKLIK